MTTRPLPPGPVEHDEDGDPVPQPADDSDVRDLQQLLEYGRSKDFAFSGPITIGKISIGQVVDLRQRRKFERPTASDPGVWAEHGFDPDADR